MLEHIMVNKAVSTYMASIGSKGGRKSRRKLDPEQARQMVLVREARKAFREFHSSCFWSSPKDYRVRKEDISWVVDQLKRHGGRAGWLRAERLCR